jgi:phage gp45-like
MNRWAEDQEGVRTALRRAAVTKVDDTGPQQLCELTALAGEKLKQIVRIQPHGFSSNPPDKSKGVLLCLGSRSDRAMILGLEDPKTRQRNLPTGTSILYDDKGNIIFMKGDKGIITDVQKGDYALTVEEGNYAVTTNKGTIALTAKQDKITIVSQKSTVTITANGDITIDPGLNNNVYIGGGSQQSQVLTVAGASANVFARVG